MAASPDAEMAQAESLLGLTPTVRGSFLSMSPPQLTEDPQPEPAPIPEAVDEGDAWSHWSPGQPAWRAEELRLQQEALDQIIEHHEQRDHADLQRRHQTVQQLVLEASIDGAPAAAPPGPQAAAGRVGLVLDHHYLEVAAKQSALATQWEPSDLVEAVREELTRALREEAAAAPGEGEGAAAAADPGLSVVELHAADSLLRGADAHTAKARLHQRLQDSGFTLHRSPNKTRQRPTGDGRKLAPTQGATDIDVVVCLFNLAGAFAGEASVEHIVLVASDSDYRPALEYILQRGPASLRLWVLADGRPRQEGAEAHGVDGGGQMRAGYRSWLRDTPRAGILSLPRTMEALGRKSGKTVLRTPQHFVQLGRAFVPPPQGCRRWSQGGTTSCRRGSRRAGLGWRRFRTSWRC